jgi:hypothetical protein
MAIFEQSNDPKTPAIQGTADIPNINPPTAGIGVSGTVGLPADQISGGPPLAVIGVFGAADVSIATGIGVYGHSYDGTGVYGFSANATGIQGESTVAVGVKGESGGFDAVVGESSSPGHAGVTGRNTSTNPGPEAVGIYGTGGTHAGKFDGDVLVNGNIHHNGVFASTTFDAVVGESSSDAHAGVTGRNTTSGANGGVGIYGEGGQFAGKFNGDVHIMKTLYVDADIVLSNAADFAEEFDVASTGDTDPGTVMVLNDGGGVKPSCLAYDRKVAGIVSGAGEYRPGIILDKRASTRPRSALALVGKVYCKVDANYAAIETGDLLTTSPTHGHAMKAVDPLKSFGAVIGKALRPIPEGQGMIPVLVGLQ